LGKNELRGLEGGARKNENIIATTIGLEWPRIDVAVLRGVTMVRGDKNSVTVKRFRVAEKPWAKPVVENDSIKSSKEED
jgi:hypothetical protein